MKKFSLRTYLLEMMRLYCFEAIFMPFNDYQQIPYALPMVRIDIILSDIHTAIQSGIISYLMNYLERTNTAG